mmetsp:Transcript_4673/g.15605  ORF Transcript_4673/g.15605 Transcript_4673/m.15605 type:complete len:211 (-) Transcript_4673:107-739(-)
MSPRKSRTPRRPWVNSTPLLRVMIRSKCVANVASSQASPKLTLSAKRAPTWCKNSCAKKKSAAPGSTSTPQRVIFSKRKKRLTASVNHRAPRVMVVMRRVKLRVRVGKRAANARKSNTTVNSLVIARARASPRARNVRRSSSTLKSRHVVEHLASHIPSTQRFAESQRLAKKYPAVNRSTTELRTQEGAGTRVRCDRTTQGPPRIELGTC